MKMNLNVQILRLKILSSKPSDLNRALDKLFNTKLLAKIKTSTRQKENSHLNSYMKKKKKNHRQAFKK